MLEGIKTQYNIVFIDTAAVFRGGRPSIVDLAALRDPGGAVLPSVRKVRQNPVVNP